MDITHPYDALQELNKVITAHSARISEFVKNPDKDFTRNRKLGAETFIKVALNMSGGSLNKEMFNAFPIKEQRPSASAFEQQKDKVKPELFRSILHEYNRNIPDIQTMDGYRLFAVDGSDFKPPYNPNSGFTIVQQHGRNKADGTPSALSDPYCLVHANMLYDLTNRLYWDMDIDKDERGAFIRIMEKDMLPKPYIVTADRGYDGLNTIEHLNRISDCNYVIRTKTGSNALSEVAALPDKEYDGIMTFTITLSDMDKKQHPDWHKVNKPSKHYKESFSKETRYKKWDFESPCTVTCRVVKFKITDCKGNETWEVLLTNLNRFEFPISKLKEIYHRRWGEETAFMELKYAIGAIQFHSKKDDFVIMELLANMVMYNAVSRSVSAVKLKKIGKKWNHAIDFKMAVAITRRFFRIDNHAPPDDMTEELVSYTHPIRPNRPDERKSVRIKSPVWFVYHVAA